MIVYDRDPQGEVAFELPGCRDGYLARLSLDVFIEIASHSITETEFRAQMWNEMNIHGEPGLLERVAMAKGSGA
jgi:hypothetical protein